MNEDQILSTTDEIEEQLEEWAADESLTVAVTQLYNTDGDVHGHNIVHVSGPHTEANTTSTAFLSNWVEAFVSSAETAGYHFKSYSIEKVLAAINNANIDNIVVSDDVVGMGLSVVYEVNVDNNEMAKITVEIIECYRREEELTAAEAIERGLGDTDGFYITGTDTDVMVATTIYSVVDTSAEESAVDLAKSLVNAIEPDASLADPD